MSMVVFRLADELYYFEHQDKVWYLDEGLGEIVMSSLVAVEQLPWGPDVEVPIEELPFEVTRKIMEFCL